MLFRSTGNQYIIGQFNRENDRDESADTLALVFDPQDPFSGDSFGEIRFLAYITDYTDTFDSGWSDVAYAGRAEKFYIFNSFKRSISLGFNIPCYNPSELTIKHGKLNKLVSILAGKYNGGLMGGVITKLKVGNYINNLPGIITGLNFSPIQDSSWDLDNSLAFYIKVSFNFTVIGDELPQYGSTFINYSNTQTTNTNSNNQVLSNNPTQTQVNAIDPSLGPVQNTSGPSYEQPSPATQGNFYHYNEIGNIDAELDSNGNTIRTFNPAVTAQSLLKP